MVQNKAETLSTTTPKPIKDKEALSRIATFLSNSEEGSLAPDKIQLLEHIGESIRLHRAK